MAKLGTDDDRKDLVALLRATNRTLRQQPLIGRATAAIVDNLRRSIGEQLSPRVGLAPAVPTFDSIAQSVRATLRVPGTPEEAEDPPIVDAEIAENGMGYNNILYIATVLAYRSVTEAGDRPLVLIEEPEAHLHPQLQLLLADYLLTEAAASAADGPTAESGPQQGPQRTPPQVFLTTHSPNLASHLPPDRLVVMHRSTPRAPVKAAAIKDRGLPEPETRKLHRLLDVTKASLFFARGIILVEGVCEQLLFPVIARRLGCPLESVGASVIPLHGVSFETVLRLFGPGGLEIPCAIVTDSDPPIEELATPIVPGAAGRHWKEAPRIGVPSPALERLRELTGGRADVAVFPAAVTLEYDIALGREKGNADLLAALWSESTLSEAQIFTRDKIGTLTDREEQARFCWQAICRKDSGKHKAAFAHSLASRLAAGPDVPFEVPSYIEESIRFVVGRLTQPSSPPEEADADAEASH